jgi:hypothetical protein
VGSRLGWLVWGLPSALVAVGIALGAGGEPRDHRNGFRLSCAVLDTQSGEVTFHHYDDPTRPKVDPRILPRPTLRQAQGRAQTEYRPPENTAWWT